jgi:protein ImuA
MVSKTDIIARLQREILPLQGYKPRMQPAVDQGLTLFGSAFPNQSFPLGAVHEFHQADVESKVSTGGFITGLISSFAKLNSICIWVCKQQEVFPPALAYFGLRPEHVVFVELRNAKERLWAMEEALKCSGIAAVVGETEGLNFNQSRRLQLAVEKSGVTGFMISNGRMGTTASIARWKISPRKSSMDDDMPGVGFPAWDVSLLKARNGKPMHWELEWRDGRFREIMKTEEVPMLHRQTG